MTTQNIAKNMQNTTKIFKGEFDGYQTSGNQRKVIFKNIKDESGAIVKDWAFLTENLDVEEESIYKAGDIVTFEAQCVYNSLYNNEFKLINIKKARKLNA